MTGQARLKHAKRGWSRVVCAAAALPLSGVMATLWPGAVLAQRAAPELAACMAANRQAATELVQARDGEIRRHAMHAVLVSRLQGLGAGYAQLRAAAARQPRNLAECEKTAEALAAGREQLERIVGNASELAECSAANQASYGQMQATLLSLQAAGQASVPALEAASARLALLSPALNRPAPTLADCRQLTADVQAAAVQVQGMVPRAPAPAPAAVAVTPPPAAAASAAAAACRAAQTRQYNEVAQAYAQFVSAGPIAAEWMAPLQGLSERLTRLSVSIATPGTPGWDCEGIQRALGEARSELAKFKR